MRRGKKNKKVFFVIVLVILAAAVWYFHNSPVTVQNSPATTASVTNPVPNVAVADKAVAGWNTYRDSQYGYEFKYPGYITVGPDTKSSLSHPSRTLLAHHEFGFSPDPNGDFFTFGTTVEIYGINNFILDIVDEFISYDPTANMWYRDTSDADKPSAADPNYKNVFAPQNKFSPPVYLTTTGGLPAYGTFVLGEESHGTSYILIPLKSKGVMVSIELGFNSDALDGSTQAVKDLKAQFDKDFPEIVKSFTISN